MSAELLEPRIDQGSAADRAADPLGQKTQYRQWPLPIAEGKGERVGPYRLPKQLVEGGIRFDYLATQGLPGLQTVALKRVRSSITPYEEIARFRAEVRGLSRMQRQNIASCERRKPP
jgi:hypothetical protein